MKKKSLITLGIVCCMLAFLLAASGLVVYADSSECTLSKDTLIFYKGLVECYEDYQEDTKEFGGSVSDYSAPLQLTQGETELENVTWNSSNTSIAQVDANGNVTPVACGTAIITASYGGETFRCTVYVKEIRFYFWQVYTGEKSSSRWVWDNSCCPVVGKALPYKLEEITYDENGKESNRKDVTKEYPLTAANPSYIQINPGSFTALKGGSNQLDGSYGFSGSSGVCYVLKNTGVPYVQMIRFNIFTIDEYEYKEYLRIEPDDYSYVLKSSLHEGSYSYDDVFYKATDYVYYQYTSEELTWQSSDTSILTIDKVTGSQPHGIYSTAFYTVHKPGRVTITALLNNKELVSYTGDVYPSEPSTSDHDDYGSEKNITSFSISSPSSRIAAGKTVQLRVSVVPADASDKSVTWTSSNPKVAKVSSSGKVSFLKKTGGKKVTITAAANDGSGKKASITLKSMKGVVKKIQIKGKKTVKAGRTLKLKAKVKASRGANKTLEWKSSNPEYATVKNGKVKALEAGKGKKVIITARALDGSNKKASIKITIK